MNLAHDEVQHQFRIEDGPYQGILLYARRERRLDFYHVYVPDPLRGKGVAGRLIKAAFDYAQANGFRVTATCPFIAGDFLPRFPEYQSFVEPGSFCFR